MTCLKVAPWGEGALDPEATSAFRGLIRHLTEGRQGEPWCRWVVETIADGAFLVGDAREMGGIERIDEILDAVVQAFLQEVPNHEPSNPTQDNNRTHPSLTVLLQSDFPLEPAEKEISRCRPSLLRRGIMAAIVHPDSQHKPLTPGPPGAPFWAPEPFLTVRWTVPDDTIFVGVNPRLQEIHETWLANRSNEASCGEV